MTEGTLKLDALIRRYLQLPAATRLLDDTPVKTLGAANWQVVDLGLAVGEEFGVELTADESLALATVGDWRTLLER